ncbi:NnrS family protein [Shimia sp.]|uniref:NnrS family protein n=1 Tax=Shimia sp. TaxID=1954381 RepID=UPI00329A51BF
MVPAYLDTADKRAGRTGSVIPVWQNWPGMVLLIVGNVVFVAGHQQIGEAVFALVAFVLIVQMVRWPLRAALRDPLLAMLVIGFMWLPIGLLLFFIGGVGTSGATHALTMGAMGGLIMAVSARAFAHRMDDGLRVRGPVVLCFALITLATVLRMAGVLDFAAIAWCFGWLIYFLTLLPLLHGPVPRPVFSGARSR